MGELKLFSDILFFGRLTFSLWTQTYAQAGARIKQFYYYENTNITKK